MSQNDPEPLSERDRAIVECLRILARRGRALREATAKQAADQACSPVGNKSEPAVNAPCSKEKEADDNSLKDAHSQDDQLLQASSVADLYDI